MWGKEGIVTPLCKLSYQENIARLQIELATKLSKYCTSLSFLGSICGSTSCVIKGAQFAPQCSLYSNNSPRILGLIALLHFARLCPIKRSSLYLIVRLPWISVLSSLSQNMDFSKKSLDPRNTACGMVKWAHKTQNYRPITGCGRSLFVSGILKSSLQMQGLKCL